MKNLILAEKTKIKSVHLLFIKTKKSKINIKQKYKSILISINIINIFYIFYNLWFFLEMLFWKHKMLYIKK